MLINGNRKLPLTLGYFALALAFAANSPASPASSTGQATAMSVNQQMGKIGESMQAIYPIILEGDDKLTPLEITQLHKSIIDLQQHLAPLNEVFEKRSETRLLSMRAINEHLDQAQTALKSGYHKHAINMLRSTSTLCMSCHTQDDHLRSLPESKTLGLKNPFAIAEYLYMTRSYPQALGAFKNYLSNNKQINYNKDTIDALDRILVIYIQVLKQPEKALAYFSGLLESGHPDTDVGRDISLWIKGLHTLPDQIANRQNDYKSLKELTDKYIFKHGEKTGPIHIDEQSRPFYIWLRGELYTFIDKQASEEHIPAALYWLAITDRTLEYHFFYSLADLYLKQCIIEHSSSPYAKRCYKEYENYITFAYSGSGGTHIPKDLLDELEALKKYLH